MHGDEGDLHHLGISQSGRTGWGRKEVAIQRLLPSPRWETFRAVKVGIEERMPSREIGSK